MEPNGIWRIRDWHKLSPRLCTFCWYRHCHRCDFATRLTCPSAFFSRKGAAIQQFFLRFFAGTGRL